MSKVIEEFKKLNTRQKISVVLSTAGSLFFLTLIILKLASISTVTVGTANLSYPSPSASEAPSASVSPTDSKASATPSAKEVPFESASLSTADLHAMQQRANDGMSNFYEWKAGETAAQRLDRMKPYFTSDSSALTLAPDSQNISVFDKGQMISKGSIDTISLGKGTDSEYKLTLGVVVKGQYNYSGKIDQQSMILERKDNVSVIMSKADGDWKIKSFAPVK